MARALPLQMPPVGPTSSRRSQRARRFDVAARPPPGAELLHSTVERQSISGPAVLDGAPPRVDVPSVTTATVAKNFLACCGNGSSTTSFFHQRKRGAIKARRYHVQVSARTSRFGSKGWQPGGVKNGALSDDHHQSAGKAVVSWEVARTIGKTNVDVHRCGKKASRCTQSCGSEPRRSPICQPHPALPLPGFAYGQQQGRCLSSIPPFVACFRVGSPEPLPLPHVHSKEFPTPRRHSKGSPATAVSTRAPSPMSCTGRLDGSVGHSPSWPSRPATCSPPPVSCLSWCLTGETGSTERVHVDNGVGSVEADAAPFRGGCFPVGADCERIVDWLPLRRRPRLLERPHGFYAQLSDDCDNASATPAWSPCHGGSEKLSDMSPHWVVTNRLKDSVTTYRQRRRHSWILQRYSLDHAAVRQTESRNGEQFRSGCPVDDWLAATDEQAPPRGIGLPCRSRRTSLGDPAVVQRLRQDVDESNKEHEPETDGHGIATPGSGVSAVGGFGGLRDDPETEVRRLRLHKERKDRFKLASEEDLSRAQLVLSYHSSIPEGKTRQEKHDVILAVLADFGIQGRTRAEIIGVRREASFHETHSLASLDQFSYVVEAARRCMHVASASASQHAFQICDKSSRGCLDREEALSMLAWLGIGPTDPESEAEVFAMLEVLHVVEGYLPVEEAEYLVQLAREYHISRRRILELHILNEEDLPSACAFEFRGQLGQFREAFQQIDGDGDGMLCPEEAMHLMTDCGHIEDGEDAENGAAWLQSGIDAQKETVGIQFAHVLEIARWSREHHRIAISERLSELFGQLVGDKLGALDMRGTCRLLDHIGLAPKSLSEQFYIAELIEIADVNHDGCLQLDELGDLVQRIEERLFFERRQVQNEIAMKAGMDRHQIFVLRNVFAKVDTDHRGLDTRQVYRALRLLNSSGSQEAVKHAMAEISFGKSERLDFCKFVSVVQQYEVRAAMLKKATEAEDQDIDGVIPREASQTVIDLETKKHKSVRIAKAVNCLFGIRRNSVASSSSPAREAQ
eukprot:TRINITY_DN68101_c0_g1_i1.p1 TRINITY_DN68101_c0_g1~~TRINITY_DN68101_c0_g1_i1.p1  ORF type:complete len:1024 (-),score=145.40 TRINITY_DN68101_c0_g1_i1:93-3164(-)